MYIFALCFVVNDVNDDHDDGFIEVHDPRGAPKSNLHPQAFLISADNCDNHNLLFIFNNNNCDNSNWNGDDALTVVRDSTSYTFVAAAAAADDDDDDNDDDNNDDDAIKVVLVDDDDADDDDDASTGRLSSS